MATSELCQCTIGLSLAEECHQKRLCRQVGFTPIVDLSVDEKRLLEWRCGRSFTDSGDTVCHHHMKMYITGFENEQKKCADPFSVHQSQVKSNFKHIVH